MLDHSNLLLSPLFEYFRYILCICLYYYYLYCEVSTRTLYLNFLIFLFEYSYLCQYYIGSMCFIIMNQSYNVLGNLCLGDHLYILDTFLDCYHNII